ncbi:SigE family RNA polymerase sigma factor [Myceligenerans crystallogenes]|uniref:SigE family RNA polymerase sigma factor n=1 Tax=Myceligenerans crystallogenes TaxID=316335 RepID=A0ABN2NRS2_9MICO
MSAIEELSVRVRPPDPAGGERFGVVRTGVSAQDEFREFAVVHTASLHRMAYLLCGDEHRAHDLVQTALYRTYRHWSKVRGGNPYGYARRVVATARIDGWRKTRREVLQAPRDVAVAADGTSHAGDGAPSFLERDRLVRALRQLGQRQRRVVVLRHLLDLSEADVAAELGVTTGTVKSQLARGLARLREILEGTEA